MVRTDISLPGKPPPTPKNSSQVARLVRQKKLELQRETDPETRESILVDLVDQLSRFGIARERDQQLVKQSFTQWREANLKNTKQDERHLGKKELKLGRILDGEEIAILVEAREEADRKKTVTQATNAQRAQTSRPAKTKTSCKSKTAGL